jgi:hypothetical protein
LIVILKFLKSVRADIFDLNKKIGVAEEKKQRKGPESGNISHVIPGSKRSMSGTSKDDPNIGEVHSAKLILKRLFRFTSTRERSY